MSERSGIYPRLKVDTAGSGVLSQAGAMLLTETIRVSGLERALLAALDGWKPVRAVHDPAKIVCDLALMLAVDGDCLADIALLRSRAVGVRAGGVGSDGVTHDRRARPRRRLGTGR